jgi:hypothetical protein
LFESVQDDLQNRLCPSTPSALLNRRFLSISFALVAAALSTAGGGCMIPSYHLPAGYSSTYQRQIYGMEPPPGNGPADPGISTEARRRIFYAPPTSAETLAAANRAPAAPAPAGAEPMILGSDPVTAPKAVQRTSYDSP